MSAADSVREGGREARLLSSLEKQSGTALGVTTPAEPDRPQLAPGVELVGEFSGSGFEERQWLVRRDSRYIQLSELLFRIAAEANGRRSVAHIARRLSRQGDVRVTPSQVRQLIDAHLVPVGVMRGSGGSAPAPQPVRRSLLGLTLKKEILPAGAANAAADALKVLYYPALLLPLLVLAAAAHVWLYFGGQLSASIVELIYAPGLFLPVLGVYLLSAGFHELGHAAALRYAGGHVGGMGVGLFLVYPAFYTDVTDSYRLPRWSRVRTGVGGLYFHLLVSGLMIGAFVLLNAPFLAVSVLLINAEMLRQFFPFVRLDGYWILADLTGIPDLFTQLTAFLRRAPGGKAPALRPWVKRVFVTYIVLVVPVLALLLIVALSSVPWIAGATWDATLQRVAAAEAALLGSDFLDAGLEVLQIPLGALPLLGIAVFATLLARRLAAMATRWLVGATRRTEG